MIRTVDGNDVFLATGGLEPTGDTAPAMILVHGAGMDSSAWQLQTRHLAHRARAIGQGPVAAVDLPDHGRSGGPALQSIGALADWLARLLTDWIEGDNSSGPGPEAAPVVVGHSMASFVTLELAARHPQLVSRLVLMGTATAMPIHPDLSAAADSDVPRAAALMSGWSHHKASHLGPHPAPGMVMTSGAQALIERSKPGVLATDLAACAAYDAALQSVAELACPLTVVAGGADKMTPARSARAVVEAATEAGVAAEFVTLSCGHMMMTEAPADVRAILVDALGR